MDKSLRIGMFVGSFPVISETFILRQITGLLDLGHSVQIFSDTKPESTEPVHPQVAKYNLLAHTTYTDMPLESAPWEMPVWPITGRTWLPGSEKPVSNLRRVCAALPIFSEALSAAPGLT